MILANTEAWFRWAQLAADGNGSGGPREKSPNGATTSSISAFQHPTMEFTINKSQALLSPSQIPPSAPQIKNLDDDTPWHKNKLPLCTREDIIHGQWTPTKLDKVPYITTTVHLRCHDKAHYLQKPYPTWKWKPFNDACDFTKWRQNMFCKVAQHSTVMIVGDSLSWEQYSSLVQLATGEPTHQGYQHQSKYLHQNIVHTACPIKGGNDGDKMDSVRLVYRRDDRLLNLTSALEQEFPTTLILNRGAHYVEDDVLLREMEPNWKVVRSWLQQCRDVHGIKCHFFWRTSVPGHPKCSNFQEPVNNLSEMEAWIANKDNYDDHTINYHWYDYQDQNQLMLKEIDNQIGPHFSYEILDAYYLNVLRPDEHRAHQNDCLHNCYPGKMDVYNQLLLHYLRNSTKSSDIAKRKTAHLLRSGGSRKTTYEKEKWMEEDQRLRNNKQTRPNQSNLQGEIELFGYTIGL